MNNEGLTYYIKIWVYITWISERASFSGLFLIIFLTYVCIFVIQDSRTILYHFYIDFSYKANLLVNIFAFPCKIPNLLDMNVLSQSQCNLNHNIYIDELLCTWHNHCWKNHFLKGKVCSSNRIHQNRTTKVFLSKSHHQSKICNRIKIFTHIMGTTISNLSEEYEIPSNNSTSEFMFIKLNKLAEIWHL